MEGREESEGWQRFALLPEKEMESEEDGPVCVMQGEFGLVEGRGRWIGSDDATSCVISIFEHAGRATALCAHAASPGQVRHLEKILTDVFGQNVLNVWLLGGRQDKYSSIDSAAADIIDLVARRGDRVMLSYVGDNVPVLLRGCAFQIGNPESFTPAIWTKFGPADIRRGARWFACPDGNEKLFCCYDRNRWCEPDFELRPLSRSCREQFRFLLETLTDEEWLADFSTTPKLERERFVPSLKAMLNWMCNYD